ncbi:MAG: DUF5317 family protein [Acidimicrobiales bacterium]
MRLPHVELRAPSLLIASLALQVAIRLLPAGGRFPALLAANVLVGYWLLVNLRERVVPVALAFSLVSIGWGMNLIAISLNGGMPVSIEAVQRVGATAGQLDEAVLLKHTPADQGLLDQWLGDVIPVPPVDMVVSLGDIVMGAGLATLMGLGLVLRSEPQLSASP